MWRPGHPPRANRVVTQPHPAPRPSPARQWEPGAEGRTRPHAFPGSPTSPTKWGRRWLATLLGAPGPAPQALSTLSPGPEGQGRGRAELTPTPQSASTPAPATPLHLTLPAAHAHRRLGGPGGERGALGPQGRAATSLPPDSEGVQPVNKGNISLGTLGVPAEPPSMGSPAQSRPWGQGAPGQAPGNLEGASSPGGRAPSQGASMRGVVLTWALGCTQWLGTSHPSPGPGPSQRQSGPQRQGQSCTQSPPQARGVPREGVPCRRTLSCLEVRLRRPPP